MMRNLNPDVFEQLDRSAIRVTKVTLPGDGTAVVEYTVRLPDTEVADVDRATALLVEHRAGPGDFVLAIGGGSAIDLAKAAAAMAMSFSPGDIAIGSAPAGAPVAMSNLRITATGGSNQPTPPS